MFSLWCLLHHQWFLGLLWDYVLMIKATLATSLVLVVAPAKMPLPLQQLLLPSAFSSLLASLWVRPGWAQALFHRWRLPVGYQSPFGFRWPHGLVLSCYNCQTLFQICVIWTNWRHFSCHLHIWSFLFDVWFYLRKSWRPEASSEPALIRRPYLPLVCRFGLP